MTTTGVYGFLWLNPAVWSGAMFREVQSIWQISVLTDGVPSILQSICFILILSNVYARTWKCSFPGIRCYHMVSPPTLLNALLHLFSSDFLTSCKKATLRKCNGICSPLLQVGQPNRAIRQDIHHYPVGWSKWPWCRLHTQFQIPLGSIMGTFKQWEHGQPSHLILTILDVIRVWCYTERE